MRASWCGALLALCLSGAAWATAIERPLADPAQEAAARQLFGALKCVVCEGQSLADSDAKLAVQMRARIRQLLAEGKKPEEVLAIFREGYGDTILMAPPMAGNAVLLWVLPALLLAVGAGALWRYTRVQGAEHD